MPTDYKKLLEACPLVDAQKQTGDAYHGLPYSAPDAVKKAARERWRAAHHAESLGALEAQPELKASVEEGERARAMLRANPTKTREERDDLNDKGVDGRDAIYEAVDTLRRACNTPSS